MKDKIYSFLSRKVNMDNAISACMITFLVTLVMVVLWVTILAGGFGNLISTVKFAQMLSVLDRVYIGDADTEAVSELVYDTMVHSLGDRWSYYMTADEYKQYQQIQSNQYSGIGVSLQKDERGWLIVNVEEDSPAAKAGIEANTYLAFVNGIDVSQMESTEIAAMMREDPENITVETEDMEGVRHSYSVVIEVIYSNPVSYEMKDGKIGYIQIENFDETCAEKTIEAIEALIAQEADALVFDVRNNGGGFVNELCDLLDYLLPEGDIFVSVDMKGKEKVTQSDKSCVELPMAVLVNENSYSAAEFFAAALREYDAATVVGWQTSGKNRSQTNVILVDGSAVHISSKRYLTPNRVDLTEQGGLTPDIILEYGENDAQLEAALELFR